MECSEDFFEKENQSSLRDFEGEARYGREWILMRSGILLSELLERQTFAIGFTERGEELNYWVRQETDAVPSPPLGHGPHSLSFLLEGFNREKAQTERLRLHVPITGVFDQTDPESVRQVTDPDEVYAEKLEPDSGRFRVVGRYLINHAQTLVYTEEEGEYVPVIEGDLDSDSIDRPVLEELERLQPIRLNFVKFKVIQQRRRTVGGDSNQDL